jgi:hypothetical protein
MSFGKKKHEDEEKDPAAMSRQLREQALRVTAADLNLEASGARPHVWGVLMELGYSEAVATLAAFADGSTSLYISSGGGMIGAGEHKPVRDEAEKFLMTVQEHIGEFTPTDETPTPSAGRVRFYVRTFASTLTAEADEKLLGNRLHKLSPVYIAGHAVLTQMRLISERRDEE